MVLHQGMGALGQLVDVHPSRQDVTEQLDHLVGGAVPDRLHPERHLLNGADQADLLGEASVRDKQGVLGDCQFLLLVCQTHLGAPFWKLD